MKRKILSILAVVTALGIVAAIPAAGQQSSTLIEKTTLSPYRDTLDSSKNNLATAAITLGSENITGITGNAKLKEISPSGNGKSVFSGAKSEITYTADIPAGMYTVRVTYYPEEGRSSFATRQIKINDNVPFDEAGALRFYSIYADEGGISQDFYGNDIRPVQVKAPRWITKELYDNNHYEITPLAFSFPGGVTTFTLSGDEGNISIYSIELLPVVPLKSYSKVKSEYKVMGLNEDKRTLTVIQAENPNYKSSPTLVPTTDSSSSTIPHSNNLVKINKISGNNFKEAGQFISYSVSVKKEGLYRISLKTKQNYTKGLYSVRRLYINDKIPFEEANNIRFTYTKDWKNTILRGEEPWLFHLKEGENFITLETTLGDMGSVLNTTQEILENLNLVYREILVITGSSPDTYRDYRLGTLLPETIKLMKTEKERLTEVFDSIYKITGQKGGDFSVFDTLITQLETFTKDPDKIPAGFTYFKTNIGSLGTWLSGAAKQPLDIDSISVYGSEMEPEKANVSFIKSLVNSVAAFIYSFTVDYNRIGNLNESNEKPLRVWMPSGRDQVQILKQLIQNDFTRTKGINVQLENVEAAAVLKAVAAANGPDVLLGAGGSDPVNYALRGAAYDLNKFEDIGTVTKQFYPEAIVPFKLNGALYALPENISFQVLYYRSDIFADLKLSLPETWDDVITLISVFQKNNMTFGIPASSAAVVSTYSTFMYQMGGEMYSSDGKNCQISDKKNTEAFEKMTHFFSNYGLMQQYDFANQFRTGEMPAAIDSLAAYNSLKVSAPEIEGLWGIALLPGFQGENGINRTGYLSSTASMILSNTTMPDKAFTFLKWWTSTNVQLKFGTELESVLGPSARYLTANEEAFKSLNWTESELSVLTSQLKTSRALPEVPGGYYLGRHLNNAFRAVLIQNKDIKDTLDKYQDIINEELASKRKEFGF